jgi:hypothetical protein
MRFYQQIECVDIGLHGVVGCLHREIQFVAGEKSRLVVVPARVEGREKTRRRWLPGTVGGFLHRKQQQIGMVEPLGDCGRQNTEQGEQGEVSHTFDFESKLMVNAGEQENGAVLNVFRPYFRDTARFLFLTQPKQEQP